MTNPKDGLRLHAFVDGELDLAAQLAMEARLRDDPACRAQERGLRELRQAVREGAAYHAAPVDLRQRVQALVAPVATAAPRRTRRPWFASPAWAGAAGVAVAALLIVSATLLPLQDRQRSQRIEEDVLASHVRATLGQRAVDVATSDHHTVKPWLSSRLDFSPPVPQRDKGDSSLLGGRVDYVGGRPVAVLAWQHGEHEADEFIWPDPASDRRLAVSSARGFNMAHWSRSGMAHWLVSDLNPGELAQLARQLGAVD
jgi:anti-sigma factor RsiW